MFFFSESQAEYYTKLKHLIEETYSTNENKKITLMTHSLGSVLTLVFLNKQASSWKDKYILQWIAMAGLYLKRKTSCYPSKCIYPWCINCGLRTETNQINASNHRLHGVSREGKTGLLRARSIDPIPE